MFRNRGASATRTARLTAVADDRITLAKTDERSTLVTDGWPERVVTHEILPGNIGYVRVRFELDLPAELPGDHTPTLQEFREAVHEFVQAGVRGVVVDVRRNSGGSDKMVAEMMASFYDERSFYEYADWYDTATGAWEIWDLDEWTGEPLAPEVGVWIEPGRERYDGPVVALVDNACVSSGEGVALGIRRLANGRTVGFHGTNGSFGMVGRDSLRCCPAALHVGSRPTAAPRVRDGPEPVGGHVQVVVCLEAEPELRRACRRTAPGAALSRPRCASCRGRSR